MKSKTLSSAILVALLATAASAQAAPEFYGNIDLGINVQDVNGQKTSRIENGNSSASTFGIRGSEDLGGGVKAIFQMEGSFKGDDGTTTTTTKDGVVTSAQTFNRDTFVGLTSGAHTVKLGRLKTLNRAALLEYDAFGASAWGIAMSAIEQNGNFVSNSAQYDYAAGAIKASFQHTAGEQANGSISGGSTDAVQLRYATGPLSATLTHTRVDEAAPLAAKATNTMVAAGYDFGVVKTTVMYQDLKASKALPTDKLYVVSATAPLNSTVSVMAQVGHVKMVNGDQSDLFALGGTYTLSKRTNLYASLTKSDLAGINSKQFVAGIRHKF